MTFDPDDPRLTAFALGELDENEQQAIVAELENGNSLEALRFIEEIRATARLLTDRLHQEPTPGLAPEHRLTIEDRLRPTRPKPRFRVSLMRLAVAAGIIGVLVTLLLPAVQSAREAARRRNRLRARRDRRGPRTGRCRTPRKRLGPSPNGETPTLSSNKRSS